MTSGDMQQRLHDWVVREQEILWSELLVDIRRAIRSWSIGASDTARRIITAARLVGPTSYTMVPWDLLAGGVYEAVWAVGGIDATMPSEEDWTQIEVMMSAYGDKREALLVKFQDTVAHIVRDADLRYLQDGAET